MEQLIQILMDVLAPAKRYWREPAVIIAAVTVRLLRPKVSEWFTKWRHDQWPATQAKAMSTRVLSSQRDWAVFYYYFVGSQRHGGYRMFHARNAKQAQQSATWLRGKSFMVRYNPAKPQQSAVLAVDNPGLGAFKA